MSLSLHVQRRLRPATLLLSVLLAGCGGSGSNNTSTPVVDALTNPDHILFLSGRAPAGNWLYYAMNPDGSGVVPLPMLDYNGEDARYTIDLDVNQSGTLVTRTISGAFGPERYLIDLSNGNAVLFDRAIPGKTFAVNSTGTQIALAGPLSATDPYPITLMAPDKTNQKQVATVPDGKYAGEITFAPDDQTLYYVVVPVPSGGYTALDAGPSKAAGALYKLTSGGTPVLLADIGAQIQSVHASRDGKQVAFISYTQAADGSSFTFTPYTLNADGTGLTKGAVTTSTGSVTPLNVSIASRADGFHVLYVARVAGIDELFDMRPNGSNLHQVTFNTGGNDVPLSRAATSGSIRLLGGR